VRAPAFWLADGPLPVLLSPLAGAWGAAARLRRRRAGWRAPVPVICVGNLVAGGAGKTPVALAVARRLALQLRAPHLLSRGYGGSARGPLCVDPARHDAGVVGDEPLLLASAAPTWVARDRVAGARAALARGAGCIVLDDGFQDPSLVKDASLLVIDGAYGFGNERLLPAGPLREPVSEGLARAHAAVLLGDDRHGLRRRLGALPMLGARLAAGAGADAVRGEPVVAFAGIGRPEKFFDTLQSLSCELLGRHPFADHHRYRDHEVLALADKAVRLGALLVTTAKDRARLPEHLRALVNAVEVEVAWDAPEALDAALARPFAER
jgi:tetraacyldisaccharide 4'-kinase